MHARRQADAAYLATTLQLQREMSDRIFQHRTALIRDPAVAKLYYEAIPDLAKHIDESAAGIESIVTIRNAIDGLQDMYFLRKRGIVELYHWRHWAAAFNVVSRLPMTRLVFENTVALNALEPEFVEFFRPLFDGKTLADPKGSP